ncbi:MAG TPA: fatty acid desaturase, partial [Pseudomonadales bacterium]|nr:fatty acid desaturase [Pseudomonadales bacterium]
LALTYAFAGYIGGWLSIMSDSLWLNLFGVLWLAHAMIIAAYLIHECAHNTIFLENQSNAKLGWILMWMTGACYGTYEDIRRKHFRHHVDRADVVAFDFRPRLAQYPRLVKFMEALEWAYIPALDIMMHLLVILLPFRMETRRHLRKHVVIMLLLRGACFTLLTAYAPRILLFYPLAYMIMLTVLRFMDAFQHTYEIAETLEQPATEAAKRFDAEYEHRNTFTNLHSSRYPWLNLATLNFGYHNVHHDKPNQPWYRLPALQTQLYGEDQTQFLPFKNQLLAFHRYRTKRMLNDDEENPDILSNKGATFIGVDGVSFLTTH